MNISDIWCFKHEPSSFDNMVLDKQARTTLAKSFKEVPNLFISGPPGVGKGTFAHIFLKKTGYDHLWVNCSDETSVDNMRTKVKSFATALGITPMKIVVLNECDYLSVSGQALLRDLMEQVQSITRFILMCNYPHKIIPELVSRCQSIDLSSPPINEIAKFVMNVLKSENIKIKDLSAVSETIKKLYPDIRRIVNTLQSNVNMDTLSTIQITETTANYEKIQACIKSKDIDGIRKILRSNSINYVDLYSYIFDNMDNFNNPGEAILTIAEYLYRDSIIAIKEINFISCVVELIKKGCV